MTNPLSEVTKFFTQFTEVKCFRPSTGVQFIETISLLPFSSGSAKSSAYYDREAILAPDSIIQDGDVLVFAYGETFIVSSVNRDYAFSKNEVTKITSYLTFAPDVITFYRGVLQSVNGLKEDTRSEIYRDVPCFVKRFESSESRGFETFVNCMYVVVPKFYQLQAGDSFFYNGLDLAVVGNIIDKMGVNLYEVKEAQIV